MVESNSLLNHAVDFPFPLHVESLLTNDIDDSPRSQVTVTGSDRAGGNDGTAGDVIILQHYLLAAAMSATFKYQVSGRKPPGQREHKSAAGGSAGFKVSLLIQGGEVSFLMEPAAIGPIFG